MIKRGTPTRPSSWLADMPRRASIEADARRAMPQMRQRRHQTKGGPVAVYVVTMRIPGYADRFTTAEFSYQLPSDPRLFADGPTESPHRFPDRKRTRLCIWHPADPPSRRWIPDDGLLALFGMVAEHLFKEAWWREHGEWLGDEFPHEPDDMAIAS